jgi:hypothetical protein
MPTMSTPTPQQSSATQPADKKAKPRPEAKGVIFTDWAAI